MMFKKILIANRGEIACRIIKTAKSLGVRTVAVYSDADAKAQHVTQADEAWHIGAAPSAQSYLLADKILEVARQSGAEAIHPGYGFLSENADFAEKCAALNICFIGPPSTAIRSMGSKSAAKEIMSKANVPLVPGYYGDNQTAEFLQQQAQKIGYPVLLKASAGGGGKGMRIVESDADFYDALESCKRESMASFSDDEILIEKYIGKPRHVEIQVFADSLGNAVHLFERDCSLQRRYQKVIEEAPAPGLSDELRKTMGQVAINAANAIGYQGAGTVEFLYDNGEFYFMEMNTRLQVEHPVTEMITGIDLVEWQLLVASGQALPLKQQQITANGHSFEVRIYAEDPEQDFLPSTGAISYLSTPKQNQHVRVDTGVRQGDNISVFYDPMIAKLIVWDKDRSKALARLRAALSDYQVVGVATNLDFASAIAEHQKFEDCELSTAFIPTYQDDLLNNINPITAEDYAIAALYEVNKSVRDADLKSNLSVDPNSPWHLMTGWQNNLRNTHKFKYFANSKNERDDSVNVAIHFEHEAYTVDVLEHSFTASCRLEGTLLTVKLSNKRMDINIIENHHELHLIGHGKHSIINRHIELHEFGDEATSDQLIAPMPGSIITMNVKQGDKVIAGQTLLVMEAMKMEHSIQAHSSGVVSEIFYELGELVEEGSELIKIDSND